MSTAVKQGVNERARLRLLSSGPTFTGRMNSVVSRSTHDLAGPYGSRPGTVKDAYIRAAHRQAAGRLIAPNPSCIPAPGIGSPRAYW
jgi:hypothetical protein